MSTLSLPQPDIAPLPNISGITVEAAKEGRCQLHGWSEAMGSFAIPTLSFQLRPEEYLLGRHGERMLDTTFTQVARIILIDRHGDGMRTTPPAILRTAAMHVGIARDTGLGTGKGVS